MDAQNLQRLLGELEKALKRVRTPLDIEEALLAETVEVAGHCLDQPDCDPIDRSLIVGVFAQLLQDAATAARLLYEGAIKIGGGTMTEEDMTAVLFASVTRTVKLCRPSRKQARFDIHAGVLDSIYRKLNNTQKKLYRSRSAMLDKRGRKLNLGIPVYNDLVCGLLWCIGDELVLRKLVPPLLSLDGMRLATHPDLGKFSEQQLNNLTEETGVFQAMWDYWVHNGSDRSLRSVGPWPFHPSELQWQLRSANVDDNYRLQVVDAALFELVPQVVVKWDHWAWPVARLLYLDLATIAFHSMADVRKYLRRAGYIDQGDQYTVLREAVLHAAVSYIPYWSIGLPDFHSKDRTLPQLLHDIRSPSGQGDAPPRALIRPSKLVWSRLKGLAGDDVVEPSKEQTEVFSDSSSIQYGLASPSPEDLLSALEEAAEEEKRRQETGGLPKEEPSRAMPHATSTISIEGKDFYTSGDIASLLGIDIRTVQVHAKQGKLPAKKISRRQLTGRKGRGSVWLFPVDEIDSMGEDLEMRKKLSRYSAEEFVLRAGISKRNLRKQVTRLKKLHPNWDTGQVRMAIMEKQ